MRVRAFITHKLSEKYKDCQDRFSINPENLSVAVSDGMSESIFPHYWSEVLSSAYTDGKYQSDDDIKPLCEDWHKMVSDYIDQSRKEGTLHWRTEANFLEGKSAGATLCGVRFSNSASWSGHVLGDSCIILLKDNKIEEILSSEEKPFDSYPDFFDSNPKNPGRGKTREVSGKITDNKKLLLVSDPFSEYFSIHKEESESLIAEVLSLKSHDDFCNLVDRWRADGMHNDDSTLVIVEWNGRRDMKIEYFDDIKELIKAESATTVSTNNEQETKSEPEVSEGVIEESNTNNSNSSTEEEQTCVNNQETVSEEQTVKSEEKGTNSEEHKTKEEATKQETNSEEQEAKPEEQEVKSEQIAKEIKSQEKKQPVQTTISFEEFAATVTEKKSTQKQVEEKKSSSTTVSAQKQVEEKKTSSTTVSAQKQVEEKNTSSTTVNQNQPEEEPAAPKQKTLNQEYLINVVESYKNELDKYIRQITQKKRGIRFQKQPNINEVTKRCMSLFDELLDFIEKI